MLSLDMKRSIPNMFMFFAMSLIHFSIKMFVAQIVRQVLINTFILRKNYKQNIAFDSQGREKKEGNFITNVELSNKTVCIIIQSVDFSLNLNHNSHRIASRTTIH